MKDEIFVSTFLLHPQARAFLSFFRFSPRRKTSSLEVFSCKKRINFRRSNAQFSRSNRHEKSGSQVALAFVTEKMVKIFEIAKQ